MLIERRIIKRGMTQLFQILVVSLFVSIQWFSDSFAKDRGRFQPLNNTSVSCDIEAQTSVPAEVLKHQQGLTIFDPAKGKSAFIPWKSEETINKAIQGLKMKGKIPLLGRECGVFVSVQCLRLI